MKRILLITLLATLTLGGLVGGAWLWQENVRREATYFTDGDSIKTRASFAPIRDVLWEPAHPLPAPINSSDDEYEPRISADGQTLFVVRGRAGENADIYTSTRTLDGWTKPEPIPALSTHADELGPQPTRDGSTLYYYSDRAGGLGGFDLWRVSKEPDGAWGEPQNLGPNVNTPFNDYGPALSPDGLTLYFSSNQPREPDAMPDAEGNWPATLREQFVQTSYDLYASDLDGDGFGASVPLDALNTPSNEGSPAISPVGDFLYFASDRPGGFGGYDLYRARMLAGEVGQTEHLGHAVNSTSNELDPAIGAGGFELLFSSNRPIGDFSGVERGDDGAIASTDEPPDYNVFRSTSREVFRDVDESQASVDWAGLWSTLWPLLLLLLLFLVLLLLLRRLWVHERFRLAYHRLSLLARCVLVSILLHLLLVSLLAVWSVSNQIGEFLRESTGTKVALISHSAESIAVQIQGQITDVDVRAQDPGALSRLAMSQLSKPLPAAATVSVPRTNVQDQELQKDTTVDDASAPAPQVEPIRQQTPENSDEALVETPESATPTRTNEAQAQASPVAAGDVATRPTTATTEAQAERVTTTTAPATVVDTAESTLAQSDDARAERSFTPQASPTTPDLNASPIKTATPDDAQQVTSNETSVSVPQAQTTPIERTAIESTSSNDTTAIVNPQSTRPNVEPNAATLATVDAQAVESNVSPDAAQARPTQIEVSSAQPDAIASPTESSQASGAEASLTAQADPSEARRTESLESAPEITTATLDAGLARAEVSDASTLAKPDAAALESTVGVSPTADRHESVPMNLAEATPGAVASPAESNQASGTEAALTAQANSTEARRAESSSDQPGVTTAILETAASQPDTASDSTLATVDPKALASTVQAVPTDDRSTESVPLDIAAATPGQIASPTESLASSANEATASPQAVLETLSARNTKSLGLDESDAQPNAVAIKPGASPVVDASHSSATASNDASVSEIAPSALAQPTVAALPGVPALDLSTPMLDTKTASNTTEDATSTIASSIDIKPIDLPETATSAFATPFAAVDVASTTPRVDATETNIALPALSLPSSLPQDMLPSDMTPDLNLLSDALALAMPTDLAPRPNAFPQRAPESRKELVEQMGGSEETENAVALALEWLARNQSPDGRWTGRDFPHADEQGGQAEFDFDSGLTGIALMAFLGANHTHLDDGPYREVVAEGIDWLVAHQGPDGDLRIGETMYSQGMATIALAEAYAMTGDPLLVEPVRKAIAFIENARDEATGGWRYEPGEAGDTSVLGWQVMAMVSARRAGIDVRDESIDGARQWLDRVALPQDLGLYAYQPDMDPTMSMTAESMFIRRLLGMPRNARRMHQSADYIVGYLPNWDENADTYGWYYATLALYQHGGLHWELWNAVVMPELLANQQTRGRKLGSWDPDDQWASIGGRVYQTAICALTLEVYYRYLPTFVGDADDSAGLIQGVVVDDTTDLPIPNATIRLDVPDADPLIAVAGPDGSFEIYAPELPTHVAVSASSPGYIPSSVDMQASDIKDLVLDHEFRLSPVRADVIAIEEHPDVHHLGNDDFSGSVNSQFQNRSEGLDFERTFVLTEFQVPPYIRRAEVRILHKGTQADNPIWINGHRLADPLTDAPSDGSFEEFVARFPARWLEEGENTVRIRSVRGRSDLDDFEFVNIRIHLTETDRPR
jgi:WD40-like Beta Propeller Repeat